MNIYFIFFLLFAGCLKRNGSQTINKNGGSTPRSRKEKAGYNIFKGIFQRDRSPNILEKSHPINENKGDFLVYEFSDDVDLSFLKVEDLKGGNVKVISSKTGYLINTLDLKGISLNVEAQQFLHDGEISAKSFSVATTLYKSGQKSSVRAKKFKVMRLKDSALEVVNGGKIVGEKAAFRGAITFVNGGDISLDKEFRVIASNMFNCGTITSDFAQIYLQDSLTSFIGFRSEGVGIRSKFLQITCEDIMNFKGSEISTLDLDMDLAGYTFNDGLFRVENFGKVKTDQYINGGKSIFLGNLDLRCREILTRKKSLIYISNLLKEVKSWSISGRVELGCDYKLLHDASIHIVGGKLIFIGEGRRFIVERGAGLFGGGEVRIDGDLEYMLKDSGQYSNKRKVDEYSLYCDNFPNIEVHARNIVLDADRIDIAEHREFFSYSNLQIKAKRFRIKNFKNGLDENGQRIALNWAIKGLLEDSFNEGEALDINGVINIKMTFDDSVLSIDNNLQCQGFRSNSRALVNEKASVFVKGVFSLPANLSNKSKEFYCEQLAVPQFINSGSMIIENINEEVLKEICNEGYLFINKDLCDFKVKFLNKGGETEIVGSLNSMENLIQMDGAFLHVYGDMAVGEKKEINICSLKNEKSRIIIEGDFGLNGSLYNEPKAISHKDLEIMIRSDGQFFTVGEGNSPDLLVNDYFGYPDRVSITAHKSISKYIMGKFKNEEEKGSKVIKRGLLSFRKGILDEAKYGEKYIEKCNSLIKSLNEKKEENYIEWKREVKKIDEGKGGSSNVEEAEAEESAMKKEFEWAFNRYVSHQIQNITMDEKDMEECSEEFHNTLYKIDLSHFSNIRWKKGNIDKKRLSNISIDSRTYGLNKLTVDYEEMDGRSGIFVRGRGEFRSPVFKNLGAIKADGDIRIWSNYYFCNLRPKRPSNEILFGQIEFGRQMKEAKGISYMEQNIHGFKFEYPYSLDMAFKGISKINQIMLHLLTPRNYIIIDNEENNKDNEGNEDNDRKTFPFLNGVVAEALDWKITLRNMGMSSICAGNRGEIYDYLKLLGWDLCKDIDDIDELKIDQINSLKRANIMENFHLMISKKSLVPRGNLVKTREKQICEKLAKDLSLIYGDKEKKKKEFRSNGIHINAKELDKLSRKLRRHFIAYETVKVNGKKYLAPKLIIYAKDDLESPNGSKGEDSLQSLLRVEERCGEGLILSSKVIAIIGNKVKNSGYIGSERSVYLKCNKLERESFFYYDGNFERQFLDESIFCKNNFILKANSETNIGVNLTLVAKGDFKRDVGHLEIKGKEKKDHVFSYLNNSKSKFKRKIIGEVGGSTAYVVDGNISIGSKGKANNKKEEYREEGKKEKKNKGKEPMETDKVNHEVEHNISLSDFHMEAGKNIEIKGSGSSIKTTMGTGLEHEILRGYIWNGYSTQKKEQGILPKLIGENVDIEGDLTGNNMQIIAKDRIAVDNVDFIPAELKVSSKGRWQRVECSFPFLRSMGNLKASLKSIGRKNRDIIEDEDEDEDEYIESRVLGSKSGTMEACKGFSTFLSFLSHAINLSNETEAPSLSVEIAIHIVDGNTEYSKEMAGKFEGKNIILRGDIVELGPTEVFADEINNEKDAIINVRAAQESIKSNNKGKTIRTTLKVKTDLEGTNQLAPCSIDSQVESYSQGKGKKITKSISIRFIVKRNFNSNTSLKLDGVDVFERSGNWKNKQRKIKIEVDDSNGCLGVSFIGFFINPVPIVGYGYEKGEAELQLGRLKTFGEGEIEEFNKKNTIKGLNFNLSLRWLLNFIKDGPSTNSEGSTLKDALSSINSIDFSYNGNGVSVSPPQLMWLHKSIKYYSEIKRAKEKIEDKISDVEKSIERAREDLLSKIMENMKYYGTDIIAMEKELQISKFKIEEEKFKGKERELAKHILEEIFEEIKGLKTEEIKDMIAKIENFEKNRVESLIKELRTKWGLNDEYSGNHKLKIINKKFEKIWNTVAMVENLEIIGLEIKGEQLTIFEVYDKKRIRNFIETKLMEGKKLENILLNGSKHSYNPICKSSSMTKAPDNYKKGKFFVNFAISLLLVSTLDQTLLNKADPSSSYKLWEAYRYLQNDIKEVGLKVSKYYHGSVVHNGIKKVDGAIRYYVVDNKVCKGIFIVGGVVVSIATLPGTSLATVGAGAVIIIAGRISGVTEMARKKTEDMLYAIGFEECSYVGSHLVIAFAEGKAIGKLSGYLRAANIGNETVGEWAKMYLRGRIEGTLSLEIMSASGCRVMQSDKATISLKEVRPGKLQIITREFNQWKMARGYKGGEENSIDTIVKGLKGSLYQGREQIRDISNIEVNRVGPNILMEGGSSVPEKAVENGIVSTLSKSEAGKGVLNAIQEGRDLAIKEGMDLSSAIMANRVGLEILKGETRGLFEGETFVGKGKEKAKKVLGMDDIYKKIKKMDNELMEKGVKEKAAYSMINGEVYTMPNGEEALSIQAMEKIKILKEIKMYKGGITNLAIMEQMRRSGGGGSSRMALLEKQIGLTGERNVNILDGGKGRENKLVKEGKGKGKSKNELSKKEKNALNTSKCVMSEEEYKVLISKVPNADITDSQKKDIMKEHSKILNIKLLKEGEIEKIREQIPEVNVRKFKLVKGQKTDLLGIGEKNHEIVEWPVEILKDKFGNEIAYLTKLVYRVKIENFSAVKIFGRSGKKKDKIKRWYIPKNKKDVYSKLWLEKDREGDKTKRHGGSYWKLHKVAQASLQKTRLQTLEKNGIAMRD